MVNQKETELVHKVAYDTGYDVVTVKIYLQKVKAVTKHESISAENIATLLGIKDEEFKRRLRKIVPHTIDFKQFMQLKPEDLGSSILKDDWETKWNQN